MALCELEEPIVRLPAVLLGAHEADGVRTAEGMHTLHEWWNKPFFEYDVCGEDEVERRLEVRNRFAPELSREETEHALLYCTGTKVMVHVVSSECELIF